MPAFLISFFTLRTIPRLSGGPSLATGHNISKRRMRTSWPSFTAITKNTAHSKAEINISISATRCTKSPCRLTSIRPLQNCSAPPPGLYSDREFQIPYRVLLIPPGPIRSICFENLHRLCSRRFYSRQNDARKPCTCRRYCTGIGSSA